MVRANSNHIRLHKLNPGLNLAGSTIELIHKQGDQMQHDYIESKIHSFHDKFVLGEKLGEGQHASVFKCFMRTKFRT